MMRRYLQARWVVVLVLVAALISVWGMLGLWGNWSQARDVTLVLLCLSLPVIGIDAVSYSRQYRQRLTRQPPSDPLAAAYAQQVAELNRQLAVTQAAIRDRDVERLETLQLWSHQLKTPLTGLDLTLQLTPVDVEAGRLAVTQLSGYLDMLLTYLKLDDVTTDLVLQPVALTPLVNDVVRELRRWFTAKDLQVTVQALPTISSDRQWLHFIFTQLLTNAAKYTKRGQVTILVDGQRIGVQDTGIGIREADLPRVFERGYSGNNGRDLHTASGLGLYLSQQVAIKLGLDLSIESTVGKGTIVWLTVPQQHWVAE